MQQHDCRTDECDAAGIRDRSDHACAVTIETVLSGCKPWTTSRCIHKNTFAAVALQSITYSAQWLSEIIISTNYIHTVMDRKLSCFHCMLRLTQENFISYASCSPAVLLFIHRNPVFDQSGGDFDPIYTVPDICHSCRDKYIPVS